MSKPLTGPIKKLLSIPPELSLDDFGLALDAIFTGDANDIEIAAFLTAIRIHKLDFNAEYIAKAVETILKYSETIPDSINEEGFIDIVGTGGDSQNTFNVSTSAAIISAGMGLPICKHGGKASTSSSGSGDLMNELGVNLFKINSKTAPSIISNSNLCFLFAPAFHIGMSKVVNVRKNLGIPTIFNILGPLLNPINIKSRILGVYTKDLGRIYCEAAIAIDRSKGKKPANTMVVWGEIGLDEISPIGKSQIWFYNNKTDKIEEFELQPADFQLPEHSLDLVRSGTPAENAIKLKQILDITDYNDVKPGVDPLIDYILMNSAALAVVSGLTDNWITGMELARHSIISGSAKKALQTFITEIDKH